MRVQSIYYLYSNFIYIAPNPKNSVLKALKRLYNIKETNAKHSGKEKKLPFNMKKPPAELC